MEPLTRRRLPLLLLLLAAAAVSGLSESAAASAASPSFSPVSLSCPSPPHGGPAVPHCPPVITTPAPSLVGSSLTKFIDELPRPAVAQPAACAPASQRDNRHDLASCTCAGGTADECAHQLCPHTIPLYQMRFGELTHKFQGSRAGSRLRIRAHSLRAVVPRTDLRRARR